MSNFRQSVHSSAFRAFCPSSVQIFSEFALLVKKIEKGFFKLYCKHLYLRNYNYSDLQK